MKKNIALLAVLLILGYTTDGWCPPPTGGGTSGAVTGMAEDGSVAWTGAPKPNAANTIALGSASAEWSDLFLGDGAIIYGQNDQSATITSSATGWLFNKRISVNSALFEGGTNTFNITNGTASLDVAAGAALNIDASLQVTTGAVVLTGPFTLAAPGAAGAVLYSDGTNWTRSATPSLTALTISGANSLGLGSYSGGLVGSIGFKNGADSNDFTISAGATGADIGWTLPTAAPGGANYLLNVDADGTMGYTDPAGLGGGYTNLTSFVAQTAWRTFYSDASGDVKELAMGTDGYIFKAKGASAAPEWSNTFSAQIDDSAAQFKSATASKGTLKFDQTGITDTKVVTVKYTATVDVTHNPTLTAASYNFGAINVLATGHISGKVPMITKSDNYTLGTDDAQEAYGYMVWMSGANKTLTLPAVAAGMSVCLYSTDAEIKRVDPNASDGIRMGAARDTDGDAIASTAAIGAFVCLVADSTDGWTVLGKSGTWTAE